MNLRKTGVVLLALLLAGMAMIPLVSAADHPMPIVDWSNVAPTEPLAENDLITFVISEKTLLKTADKQQENPLITLDQNDLITDKKAEDLSAKSNLNIAPDVRANQPVAVMVIPKTLFESIKHKAGGDSVKVPRDMFRTYGSLDAFYEHQERLSTSALVATEKKYMNTSPLVFYPDLERTASTGYRYQKWDQFTTDGTGIQPTYLTGKIAPSSYQQSPSGVYIYEEEEIHLNRLDSDGDGIDVIELVAAYDVASTGGPSGGTNGINIFPVFYNADVNSNPIYTGYVHVPSAPHSYNFYVNVGSGSTLGKYEVWLQDTSTNQWLGYWTYQDNNQPSSYIRSPRVSSELTILPGASGSFNAQTSPITLEHALQGSTWSRPMEAFTFWRSVQNVPNLRFVSTTQGFQWWNGYLVQSSSCSGTI